MIRSILKTNIIFHLLVFVALCANQWLVLNLFADRIKSNDQVMDMLIEIVALQTDILNEIDIAAGCGI